MDMTPQQVRSASFKTSRKGFDPAEVAAFLARAAEALEAAQNQSTAMEARARAAVARLQEVTAAKEAEPAPAPPAVQVDPDQAETISRTLLLAQRTADTAVAEAKAEAERLLTVARDEAAATIDSTREMSAMMLDEARAEARKLSEEERQAAENEVQSLLARRDFLVADVDHLERFVIDQRTRLREAATSLLDLAERVPGGLGDVRRPLISAADESSHDDIDEQPALELDETRPIDAPTEANDSDPTPGGFAMVEDPGPRSARYDPSSADDLASLARALETRPSRFDDPTPTTDD
ncbi:MAG TPA: DivIVA domain-containing protein, partial [Ilumatobacteraceae bacterium]